MGPTPAIPPPTETLIPTINVATARGWQGRETPRARQGLNVNAFAVGLSHPRWLLVLPNGDVLVAETAAPPRPEEGQGIKGMIMMQAQATAGSAVPSANRISLLRDADGDGVAETRTAFLTGLNSPFGMALVGDQLYVANTDAVVRFPYRDGSTQIAEPGVKVADLPAGTLNHHWTKANSNIAENGMQKEERRAAILEIDIATGDTRIFASGLRNPVGVTFHPQTGELWTVVNERDELGSDLVPDYLTSVRRDGFYGWPYSYYGKHVDTRVKPPRPDLVAKAIVPDYALGNHVAALGLAFVTDSTLSPDLRDGAFVGEHGSWNRHPHSGYQVVFVPFAAGRPTGAKPIVVLDGFLTADGEARGRPVGVALDKNGALLVADDVGNRIWRVSPGQRAAVRSR
jgi:glucose/arabinose dehydrogenase